MNRPNARDAAAETLVFFTVLIRDAGPATQRIRPRCSVVISGPDRERWLTPGTEAQDLMRPPPGDQVALRELGRTAGNVRNDGPGLIEALEPGA